MPLASGVYFSYYANVSDANTGITNNDELYDASGGSAGRIAYSAASPTTEIGALAGGGGNLLGASVWNVLDTSGNLVGQYNNTDTSADFIPASSSTAFYLYPAFLGTGIYYFSNAFYAEAAYNGGSPNVTLAIYHDSRSLSSTLITQNWSSIVINNGGNYTFPDLSGNGFGWRIDYSNKNSILVKDESWILGGSTIGGSSDDTEGAYSAATVLFLSPATAPVGMGNPSYISETNTIGITTVKLIAIGVLFCNIGKDPIIDTPIYITVAGLTTDDENDFYYVPDIANYYYWEVDVILNADSISETVTIGTIIEPDSNIDTTTRTAALNNALVYAVLQKETVSVLSYYLNQTSANAGIANYDQLYDVSGASIGRIAYCLNYNASLVIGSFETGGNLNNNTIWNLIDISGNPYSGNPVSNGAELPAGSLAWYLYPDSSPPPSSTVNISYYTNSNNAISGFNSDDGASNSSVGGNSGNRIAYSEIGTTIGNVDAGGESIVSYTSWRIIDRTGVLLSGNYINGVDLSTLGEEFPLFLYPYSAPGPQVPCFLEGSQILCLVDEKETYLPIEQMRKGTLVKTLNSGYKMVHIIGKRDIPNFNDSNRIKDRLYKLTSAQYPALTSDLYLTGCHSTLVDSLTEEQKEEIKKMLGVVCVTEGKYRLPASVDKKAEPWQSAGTYTVWHFALDDENPLINFGVYANGGLIVETGSIRYLQGKANMELV